jgi:hypothetical protein
VGTKPKLNPDATANVSAPLVTPFRLAVIFVLPVATPVANPCVLGVLLMVAAAAFDEFQVAALVRFCIEPSE